jgi:hypothetical protein
MWKYKYVYKECISALLAECERLGHPDEGCFELVQIWASESSPYDGGLVEVGLSGGGYVAVLKARGSVE